MLAKLFEVKNAGDKGKGLFAKESIPVGTIVSFECQQCIGMSKDDFESILNNKERSLVLRYGYRKADGSYLLPCDEIIYLNHSCIANILDSGKGFEIVVKDVAKGEEATYDYRSFFFITQMNLNACAVKIIVARLSDPFMINTILNGVN